MEKIQNLTQAQIDKFPEYIKKYTKIALDTTPVDFEKAKQAVNKAYKCKGLKPPEKIVYCTSPYEAIIIMNKLHNNFII